MEVRVIPGLRKITLEVVEPRSVEDVARLLARADVAEVDMERSAFTRNTAKAPTVASIFEQAGITIRRVF